MGIQFTDDGTLHFTDDQIIIAQEKEDSEFISWELFKEYEN